MKLKLSSLFQNCRELFSGDKGHQDSDEQLEFQKLFRNFHDYIEENKKTIAYELASLREQYKPYNLHQSHDNSVKEFTATYNFLIEHLDENIKTIAHGLAEDLEHSRNQTERARVREAEGLPMDENRLWGGSDAERRNRTDKLIDLARNYKPNEHQTHQEPSPHEPG